MVGATLVTTGLQATEVCTEENKPAAPTTIVVEQKKVTIKDETTTKEEATKAPVLAACGENCGTTVSTPDEEIVVEVKTTNNEVFEYRKRTGKPKMGHVVQILIYMKILKKAKGVLIYENKNTHELLVIPVEVNDHYRKWIDEAFEWMRVVRKSWEVKELPTKNYRSNSKICKNCPIKTACGEAGAGVVKIASLEELSETL